MKSILEIKSELNEIKYYYSMREVFEQGAINGVPSNLENKVNVYNNAISQAPAQLYAFYISYYVNNQKRLVIANSWNTTPQNLQFINRRLCEYFQQVLA